MLELEIVDLIVQALQGTSDVLFEACEPAIVKHRHISRYAFCLTNYSQRLNLASSSFSKTALEGVLKWFAELLSKVYTCRRFASDYADSRGEICSVDSPGRVLVAELRHNISNLLAALDEELCVLDGIISNAYRDNKHNNFNATTPGSAVTLMTLHIRCRKWLKLFESVAGIVSTVSLKNATAATSKYVTHGDQGVQEGEERQGMDKRSGAAAAGATRQHSVSFTQVGESRLLNQDHSFDSGSSNNNNKREKNFNQNHNSSSCKFHDDCLSLVMRGVMDELAVIHEVSTLTTMPSRAATNDSDGTGGSAARCSWMGVQKRTTVNNAMRLQLPVRSINLFALFATQLKFGLEQKYLETAMKSLRKKSTVSEAYKEKYLFAVNSAKLTLEEMSCTRASGQLEEEEELPCGLSVAGLSKISRLNDSAADQLPIVPDELQHSFRRLASQQQELLLHSVPNHLRGHLQQWWEAVDDMHILQHFSNKIENNSFSKTSMDKLFHQSCAEYKALLVAKYQPLIKVNMRTTKFTDVNKPDLCPLQTFLQFSYCQKISGVSLSYKNMMSRICHGHGSSASLSSSKQKQKAFHMVPIDRKFVNTAAASDSHAHMSSIGFDAKSVLSTMGLKLVPVIVPLSDSSHSDLSKKNSGGFSSNTTPGSSSSSSTAPLSVGFADIITFGMPSSVKLQQTVLKAVKERLNEASHVALMFVEQQFLLSHHLKMIRNVFLLGDCEIFSPLRNLCMSFSFTDSDDSFELFSKGLNASSSALRGMESARARPKRLGRGHSSSSSRVSGSGSVDSQAYYQRPVTTGGRAGVSARIRNVEQALAQNISDAIPSISSVRRKTQHKKDTSAAVPARTVVEQRNCDNATAAAAAEGIVAEKSSIVTADNTLGTLRVTVVLQERYGGNMSGSNQYCADGLLHGSKNGELRNSTASFFSVRSAPSTSLRKASFLGNWMPGSASAMEASTSSTTPAANTNSAGAAAPTPAPAAAGGSELEEYVVQLIAGISIETHWPWPLSQMFDSGLMEDMNVVLRFLLHVSASKWLSQAWWKSTISSNNKRQYETTPPPPPPPPPSSAHGSTEAPEMSFIQVTAIVYDCKSICTSGLNMYIHFINSLHNFAMFKLHLTMWDKLEKAANEVAYASSAAGKGENLLDLVVKSGSNIRSLNQLKVMLSLTLEQMLQLVGLLSQEFLGIVNTGVAALEKWRKAVAVERNVELARALGAMGLDKMESKFGHSVVGHTSAALVDAYGSCAQEFGAVRDQIDRVKSRIQLSCETNFDETSHTTSKLISRKIAEELKLYLF